MPTPTRGAGFVTPAPVTRISLSQQFVVSGVPMLQPPFAKPHSSSGLIHLEPDTLSISCERIKEALLKQLGFEDTWRGKIYLRLKSRRNDHDPILIQGGDYGNGGVYWVDLPDLIPRRRLLDTFVQVLLLEMANRGGGEIPAELPPWLGEGVSSILEAGGVLSMLAEPFSRQTEVHRPTLAMEVLREQFRDHPVLAVNQLSWPTSTRGTPEATRYRASAHLLVHELLRLPGGRMRMAALIQGLHQHLNWQTAFLGAYRDPFPTLAAFDKWWTLTTAHFLGKDTERKEAGTEVLSQLTAILSVPLDVRVNDARITGAAAASLQQIISEWDPSRLDPVLAKKILQLEGLQLRSPQTYAPIISGYRNALANYQSQRVAAGGTARSRLHLLPNAQLAQRKVLMQLELLDRSRIEMHAQEAALSQSRRPPQPSPSPDSP